MGFPCQSLSMPILSPRVVAILGSNQVHVEPRFLAGTAHSTVYSNPHQE